MIICPKCRGSQIVKNGFSYDEKQNFKCKACGRQFVENGQQNQISVETNSPLSHVSLLLPLLPLLSFLSSPSLSSSLSISLYYIHFQLLSSYIYSYTSFRNTISNTPRFSTHVKNDFKADNYQKGQTILFKHLRAGQGCHLKNHCH